MKTKNAPLPGGNANGHTEREKKREEEERAAAFVLKSRARETVGERSGKERRKPVLSRRGSGKPLASKKKANQKRLKIRGT